jgi:hypothetical protein
MPRNANDFVSFLANHFRPIEAMCKQRARFVTDDEIVAFLRPFEADDKNLNRLIGRMREAGVLMELAGEWSPPPFLVEFMEKLFDRHGLASPEVIQSWVGSPRMEQCRLIHWGDYDPVGVYQYTRLASACVGRVDAYAPSIVDTLLPKHGKASLITRQYMYLDRLREHDSDPFVRRMIELFDQHRRGLEQEILLHESQSLDR